MLYIKGALLIGIDNLKQFIHMDGTISKRGRNSCNMSHSGGGFWSVALKYQGSLVYLPSQASALKTVHTTLVFAIIRV